MMTNTVFFAEDMEKLSGDDLAGVDFELEFDGDDANVVWILLLCKN